MAGVMVVDGPTAEEWAWVRAFIALGKNVAATKAIEFYKELETVQDRLPNFHDELFYEYHQGTLTTQHLGKYMNRHQEWGLQSAENLAALATILTGAPYPYATFHSDVEECMYTSNALHFTRIFNSRSLR